MSELVIEIKSASIFGGGLPHDVYVETVIDGEIVDTTAPKNPAEWNKTVTKALPISTNISMIILFAVFKKRWTATGYKLVGTVEFTLENLIGDLRNSLSNTLEGSITKEFTIAPNKKNLTLSGYLTLGLEIRQHSEFAFQGLRVEERGSFVGVTNPSSEANPMRNSTPQKEGIEVKPPNARNLDDGVGARSAFVNPLKGTMAGLLTSLKNADAIENILLATFSTEKTKVRWYELDREFLKSCRGQEKDYDFKKFIPVASIIDIRPFTSEAEIADLSEHTFEIETSERTYAFACETELEKSNWLVALQTCWANHRDLQSRAISTDSNGGSRGSYQSRALETRMTSVAHSDIDLNDINEVSKFLLREAASVGRSPPKLLKLLRQLLLIPPESDALWDQVSEAIHRVLMDSLETSDSLAEKGDILLNVKI